MELASMNLTQLERSHAIKVVRGIDGIDKTMKEVENTTDENRKKIRRRVEDYLRKCQPDELALIVALCGIRTEVIQE